MHFLAEIFVVELDLPAVGFSFKSAITSELSFHVQFSGAGKSLADRLPGCCNIRTFSSFHIASLKSRSPKRSYVMITCPLPLHLMFSNKSVWYNFNHDHNYLSTITNSNDSMSIFLISICYLLKITYYNALNKFAIILQ